MCTHPGVGVGSLGVGAWVRRVGGGGVWCVRSIAVWGVRVLYPGVGVVVGTTYGSTDQRPRHRPMALVKTRLADTNAQAWLTIPWR